MIFKIRHIRLKKERLGRKMSKRIEVKEIEDMIGIIKEVVRDGKKTV